MYEWNWKEADTHARKAIILEPGNSEAQRYYAWNLTFQGRSEEAVERIKRVIHMDPLQALNYQNAGAHYYFGRNFEKAIEYGKKTLELNPYFTTVKITLGSAYIQTGELDKAIKELEELDSLPGIKES